MKLEHSDETKKKQIIIIGGGAAGLIGLLVFGLWLSDPDSGKPSKRELAREQALEVKKSFRTKPNVSDEETWIAKSEETIQKQTDTIKQISRALKTIQDRLEERGINVRVVAEKKTPTTPLPLPSDIPPTLPLDGDAGSPASPLLAPLAELAPPLPGTVNRPSAPAADPLSPPQPGTPSVPRLFDPLKTPTPLGQPAAPDPDQPAIQVVTLAPTDQLTGKPKKIKNATSYLPVGSFATVRLLSGLDAPTGEAGDKNPVPVLLRVMTDGTLPNFFTSNVSSCHIIGSSWGNLASERATIQLTTLSCVLLNGDVIETNLKGYVAGEDGKHGLRGRLVSKQGALVARALLAGLAGGFGRVMQQQSQMVVGGGVVGGQAVQPALLPDPQQALQGGLGQGISTAMQQVSQYYLQQARQIFPIIEISANREGDAILQVGVSLDLPILDNTRVEEEDAE